MTVGLRIDVDTWRGTRRGVAALLDVLHEARVRATFFVSVGPDNMGRHLWRLRKPAFAAKMLRTRGLQLYGWDVLLRGTLWPGPVIGRGLADRIRAAAYAGHEVGLHAWDHHAWQARAERGEAALCTTFVRSQLEQGVALLGEILGRAPVCAAVPGWRCNDRVLVEKERFGFAFDSDCRGVRAFRPLVPGRLLSALQIPVTLPTYDEAIGRPGVSEASYNDWLLSQVQEEGLNVLAIHAEVEGIARLEMFRSFLAAARRRGIAFVPLGELGIRRELVGTGVIREREFGGREGLVACLE